jgi:hypothetical protein
MVKVFASNPKVKGSNLMNDVVYGSLTGTLQFARRAIIPNNASKSLVSIMKQAASRSIKFGSFTLGCSSKSVHGPLRGGN